jgi:hypothetical protein
MDLFFMLRIIDFSIQRILRAHAAVDLHQAVLKSFIQKHVDQIQVHQFLIEAVDARVIADIHFYIPACQAVQGIARYAHPLFQQHLISVYTHGDNPKGIHRARIGPALGAPGIHAIGNSMLRRDDEAHHYKTRQQKRLCNHTVY